MTLQDDIAAYKAANPKASRTEVSSRLEGTVPADYLNKLQQQRHEEKNRQYYRQYYLNNAEHIKEQNRLYRLNNPEHIKEQRKLYRLNQNSEERRDRRLGYDPNHQIDIVPRNYTNLTVRQAQLFPNEIDFITSDQFRQLYNDSNLICAL